MILLLLLLLPLELVCVDYNLHGHHPAEVIQNTVVLQYRPSVRPLNTVIFAIIIGILLLVQVLEVRGERDVLISCLP